MHLPCGISAWLGAGQVGARTQQQEEGPYSGPALGKHAHIRAAGGACCSLFPGGEQEQALNTAGCTTYTGALFGLSGPPSLSVSAGAVRECIE